MSRLGRREISAGVAKIDGVSAGKKVICR